MYYISVACICSEILFTLIKEGNVDTGHNMDETWEQVAGNKPVTRGQNCCDLSDEVPRVVILLETQSRLVVNRVGRRGTSGVV